MFNANHDFSNVLINVNAKVFNVLLLQIQDVPDGEIASRFEQKVILTQLQGGQPGVYIPLISRVLLHDGEKVG